LTLAAAVWSKRRQPLSAVAFLGMLLYLTYRLVIPASGASWLSQMWFGFWFR
jgi:hypothetical protein